MNDDEKYLAGTIYDAMMDMSNKSARSEQSREFRVGLSDLGFCSERVRRMLDGQVPEDTDALKAWIGTALGDHAEQAAMRAWPHAVRQATVEVTLYGETREYRITGHPDLILPDEGVLIDFKTAYGLATAERTGPSASQQFQRHCYAKGAWETGLFGSIPLEAVQVANVWIDRAGIEQRVHVQMEPFDPDKVREAGLWLDDVVYAYLQGEEARKEPPRDMCATICGFYGVCRAYDTDVEGKLSDPVTVSAVAMYREGIELERQGARLKDQAKEHLRGVEGSTGEFMVRWTHVNEVTVPETTRKGYDKLEVRALPKRKVQGKSG